MKENIYKQIAVNIHNCLDKVNNDEEFKKTCPNVTALEYLIVKSKITPKRMKNILDGTARTRIEEVYIILQVLGVPIKDILDIPKSD